MSSETVALLVKFLPTILTAVCIFLCMLRGFLRGFRKSVILLIHYIISLAAGLVVYFTATKIVLSDELNSILASISPKFAEANSLYDVVGILVNSYLPDFASLIGNEHLQQVVMALVGVGVSLVFGIVCLIIFPWVVRVVLYLLYLLFYREGKVKRHKEAEGDDYHAHRLMGTLVGVVRGLVWSVLLVSIFSSTFYIASGGISTNEEVEDLEILDKLEEMIDLEGISSSIGVELDLNVIYEALKQSRSTGVGVLFDAIKINGTPIDLYYADLYLSSSFNTLPQADGKLEEVFAYLSEEEAIKSELAKISIREELAMIVGLVEQVLESNAITIEDNTIVISPEILEVEIGVLVDEYINGSTLMSDLTPLAIVGLAEAINEGNLSAGDKAIDDLFDEETIELIKEVNIVKDLGKILKSAFKLVNKLPVFNEDGEFDLAVLQDVNTYLNLDVDTVKEVFADFGQIDTLTKVVFPVGIGFALSNYSDMISSVGINPTELDFTDVDWGFELTNLGNIYEGVISLGLDLDKLLDSTTNEETGLTNQIEYIIDLVSNEETSPVFKENLIGLVDTVFESELFSQVGLVFVKSKIAEFELGQDDEALATLNDSLNLVKKNLENYTEKNLRDDLHELISSGLNVTSLLPLLMGNMEEVNIFELLYEIPTEDVKKALLGTYNEDLDKYQGGIYSLRLLTGDLNNDGNTDPGCFYATDSFVEAALKTYAKDLISVEVVDSITSVKDSDGNLVKLNPTDPGYNFNAWPNEIEALINAISDLQTVESLKEINLNFEGEEIDITQILPESLTDSDIDVITAAASRSKLLSAIIKDTLVNALKEQEMIGEAIDDPNIVWMDTLDEDGEVVSYGELNSLLKGFKVLSEDDKAIDLNNPDTLVNGLGLLIREATNEELNDPTKQDLILNGLNYEDVMYFTKSQVVMKLLSTVISSLGEGEESLPIVLPSELKTDGEGNEDNWKNWAMDHNGDYKQGEFAKLILIMYHAREYALNNPTEVVTPTAEEENAPVLTINNLLNSVIYMDKDEIVTNSLVLYATVSSVIMSLEDAEDAIITIPTNAKQDGEIVIIKEEINKLLAVVRNLEIPLENNDFSNISVESIVNKLNESNVRESISISNIFSATIINILTDIEEIVVPREYQILNENGVLVTNINHPVWYSSQLSDWEDSEVAKLLASVAELELEIVDGNVAFPEDPTELLTKLNKPSNTADSNEGLYKIDVIYSSALLRTTVSDIIFNLEEVLYREEALVSEEFMVSETSDKNISKDEISKLITLLEKLELDFGEGSSIEVGKIVKKLEDEETRQLIAESNILNITIVDTLVKTEGIHIPASFKTEGKADPYKDAWYPSETLNWDECELGKLLASVVELDLKVVDNNIEFPENPTELLTNLEKDSITNKQENKTRLNVVYLSEIIKQTLKVTVEEIEDIKIRDEAYEGNDKASYIKEIEVKRLIDLASNDGVDFENIEVSVIIDLLKLEDNRQLITESNILNITIVDTLVQTDGIHIPATFKTEGKADPYKDAWYPSETLDWDECELGKLLASVVELDLKVVDNNIEFPENPTELLTNLEKDSITNKQENKTRLNVVYLSEIIKQTLKVTVEEIEDIKIRDEAYEGNDKDSYIKEIEVKRLADLASNPDLDFNNLKVSVVFDLLKLEENRKTITESNILNITVVSKFDGVDELDMPETLMLNGKVNIYADEWYPNEFGWENCELAHLLDGVVELGITVDKNDNIVIPPTADLLESLNGTNEAGEAKLDIIYSSGIMSTTISKKITSQDGIVVRNNAYAENEDGVKTNILDVEEIRLLLEFIDVTQISFEGNGISVSDVFNSLTSEETGERTRYIIVTSNILNATVVSKFDGVEGLSIPEKYLIDGKINVEAEEWYASNSSLYSLRRDWENCELARLLNSIVELGITAKGDDIEVPGTKELFESLTDEKLDIVYLSEIIKLTIKDKLEENDELMIRNVAYDTENYIKLEEISSLVKFVNEGNINIESIEVSTIFNLLNVESNRQIITESNILNITVVSKLDNADGLSIPTKFKDGDKIDLNAEGWYPKDTGEWYESELARLLNSIVELGITAKGDDIEVPGTKELFESLTDEKLDIVYLSEVIKLTIKDKLEENDELMIRNAAYDSENYIKLEEISSLVKFVNEGNIDLESIEVSTIFNLLNVESNRQIITESNILNITVVSKFDGVEGLSIPTKFKDGDKIDLNAEGWYPKDTGEWYESELARLLNSIVELGITAKGDDIEVPGTKELFESLTDEKLAIVYASDIISMTISDKINNQEGIVIRKEAYVFDESGNPTTILRENEVSLLVKFINEAGISLGDDSNDLTAENIFAVIKDKEKGIEARRIIVTSNILNITVVSKFEDAEGLELPSDYLLGDGNINIHAAKWYPVNDIEWQDCELARLLNTVVELDVQVENGVPKFESNISSLLGSLSKPSVTNEGSSKLNVVYLSDLIKQTIKVKLEENDEVMIRSAAYDDENYIKQEEISLLVQFVNESELELTNLDASQLFNVLEGSQGNELRRIIVVSNILNITTVDKIAGDAPQTDASAIKFASAYLNKDNTVNKEASAWYPENADDYQNCELYHLLICVDELGITASGNEISVSINDKLDMLLTPAKHGTNGETKLDVAYLSDSIANTISYRLNEFADIPLYSYNNEMVFDETPNRNVSDRIISGKEVKALLAGLEALGMKFSSGSLAASDIENIALDKLVTNIDDVLESSILHYIISTKLIEQTQSDSSIVVYNYWSGNETYADIEVVKVIGEGRYDEDGTYIYVHTNQIKESIEVLNKMGIDSFESISNINKIEDIAKYFDKATDEYYTADMLVNDITESAIVSKIFSQLLVTLPTLGFQGITPLDVVEVYDNETVKAITIKDLKTLLALYA